MRSARYIPITLLVLVLCIALTSGFAFVAPKKTVPSVDPKFTAEPSSTDEQDLFLAMKAAAKPFQAVMRENSQTFTALREQLVADVETARIRIEEFLSTAITADQLALIESQLSSLRDLNDRIEADVGDLGAEMTILRGRNTDLDMDGMIAAYEAAIQIQNGRIALAEEAIALVNAIAR
ncbi:MAG: hypothetical protein KBA30_10505 [Clostridia bacterium]|nr:hypothetical protein [Clostridia bacterium]